MKKLIIIILSIITFIGFSLAKSETQIIKEKLNKVEMIRSQDNQTIKTGNISASFVESESGDFIKIINNKKYIKFKMPYYKMPDDKDKSQEAFIRFINISPSGKYISFETVRFEVGSFYIIDTSNGKILRKNTETICNNFWTKDGSKLIIGCIGEKQYAGLYISQKSNFSKVKKIDNISVSSAIEDNNKIIVKGSYYESYDDFYTTTYTDEDKDEIINYDSKKLVKVK